MSAISCILYPPTHDYDYMVQRPQQLMKSFSQLQIPCYYLNNPFLSRPQKGIKQINPFLYVFNDVDVRPFLKKTRPVVYFIHPDHIETIIAEISKRAPEVPKEYKAKLCARIKELLDQQAVDENRIAVEVALFADRCSIDEELVRLASHFGQMRQILSMDQPAGRKLDFLVQEMNREINTIGSKANDLTITRLVVDIKSEIEKIREQIQNIE